jgi:hypothetical protein
VPVQPSVESVPTDAPSKKKAARKPRQPKEPGEEGKPKPRKRKAKQADGGEEEPTEDGKKKKKANRLGVNRRKLKKVRHLSTEI